jgi:nitroimidazol reductase NimA-like FMN-containing flavoprotein (pyridoxamine 5'-phosphate oxidase superfamily)
MKRGISRREREVTDINEIIGILDRGKIVHVGMIDGDMPYVVPMNYGYTLEDGKLTLYLHGARRGRKIDVLRENPKVFFEMCCDITPFEGEVACKYGITYASIMGRGLATLVEDVEEKKKALSVLMKTQVNKDFTFDDKLTTVVSIIRIDTLEFTAKKRNAPKK